MRNLNQMKIIYKENLCEEFQAMHVKSYSVAIQRLQNRSQYIHMVSNLRLLKSTN